MIQLNIVVSYLST